MVNRTWRQRQNIGVASPHLVTPFTIRPVPLRDANSPAIDRFGRNGRT
jgi:hypothetical protein